jgi:RNA polymerase sigma-70 factor (ECF subfamily)
MGILNNLEESTERHENPPSTVPSLAVIRSQPTSARSGMPARVLFDHAFEKMFEQQFASLFRYMDRLSGDPDLAADIAQEAFVRLYQRGAFPDDLRGWLAAVAGNLLRDHHRSSQRRLELLKRQPPELTMGSPAPSAELEMLRDERRAAVRTVLDQLPMRDQQLLLLRHEGYSYREIGTALDIAETSVGTLLMRATAAFAAAFKEGRRASL